MKKNIIIGGMALLCMGALASCSEDNEYDSTQTILISQGNFEYNSEGVWTQNDKQGFVEDDGYEFSHIVDADGIVYGFTPSKISDTSAHDPLYTFPYACAYGGGLKGKGSQYLVGYWAEYLEGDSPMFSDRTCRIYAQDGDTFKPQSVYICNNTYMLYAGLNGTAFTEKFKAGDWVTLVAHGVHLDGTESQAVEYLVNIEDTNVEDGIVMAWKEMDLSGLGECTGIYFTMDASQSLQGAYGLDIPTYFCLDNLTVKD